MTEYWHKPTGVLVCEATRDALVGAAIYDPDEFEEAVAITASSSIGDFEPQYGRRYSRTNDRDAYHVQKMSVTDDRLSAFPGRPA